MKPVLIEKRKLGKLNILLLVTFLFTSCVVLTPTPPTIPMPTPKPIPIPIPIPVPTPTPPPAPTIPTSVFTNGGASNQTGVVSGENIVVSIRGAGSLTLSGTCNFAEITVQSAGTFKGSDLKIRDAEVSVSGSGSVYVWVTGRLNVKIQGSGSVYYKGNPQISSSITGSGRLVKM